MKFNNETIRTAVKEWLDDAKKVEKEYGHISEWDVSDVTDISHFFNQNKFQRGVAHELFSKSEVKTLAMKSSFFDKGCEIVTFEADEFLNQLNHHIDESDNSPEIQMFYNDGYYVWDKYIHRGEWNQKKYTIKVSIPYKRPQFSYSGNLIDLKNQIHKKLTDTEDSFTFDDIMEDLDIDLITDSGGSYQIDKVSWKPKLTKEEKKEVDIKKLIKFGVDFDESEEMVYDDYFWKKISVSFNNKLITFMDWGFISDVCENIGVDNADLLKIDECPDEENCYLMLRNLLWNKYKILFLLGK
jgi:hypothetical protein